MARSTKTPAGKVSPPVKRGRGRPSTYTPEIADEICHVIENGGSLNAWTMEPGRPDWSTICLWLRTHEEFSKNYAIARQSQADLYFDSVTTIADACPNDPGAVAKARLQIDVRKWAAGKMRPKVYGDKADLSITHTINPQEMTSEQRQAWIADLRASIQSRMINVTPCVDA